MYLLSEFTLSLSRTWILLERRFLFGISSLMRPFDVKTRRLLPRIKFISSSEGYVLVMWEELKVIDKLLGKVYL